MTPNQRPSYSFRPLFDLARRVGVGLGLLIALAACGSSDAGPADATVTLAGWQGQAELWDQILADFEADHPHIDVEYQAIDAVAYDEYLDGSFASRAGPDVYGCRAYDWALDRFETGDLADLSDLDAMANFDPQARSTWSTDDGSVTYCVPAIANMTGLFYNKTIFAELGLAVPTTHDELSVVLQAVTDDGRYVPLALGLGSAWVGSGLGYESIGPPYWSGEQGRWALIEGTAAFTDPEFVGPFEQLAVWSKHLPQGAAELSRLDGQALFKTGDAAMMPGGSWEIETLLRSGVDFGVFPPTVASAGDMCFVNEHPDLGFGMNPRSDEPEATRTFLEWIGGPGFATAYTTAFPGLFSLQRESPEVAEEVAAEFMAWRDRCATTPRLTGQILSRGGTNLEAELAATSIEVLAGHYDPAAAAQRMQAALTD